MTRTDALRDLSRVAAALVLLVLMLAGGAKGEETSMKKVPVALQKSYKKAGENNPLYTQRFGADPGVMEYNGRLYVYMTDDLLEYDGEKRHLLDWQRPYVTELVKAFKVLA